MKRTYIIEFYIGYKHVSIELEVDYVTTFILAAGILFLYSYYFS